MRIDAMNHGQRIAASFEDMKDRPAYRAWLR